eukprot:10810234-Lingulodinium_polyedra.AAC.1
MLPEHTFSTLGVLSALSHSATKSRGGTRELFFAGVLGACLGYHLAGQEPVAPLVLDPELADADRHPGVQPLVGIAASIPMEGAS